MKFQDMKINMIQFYNLGIVCFLVIGIANFYNLFSIWTIITFASKVSSLASIVFNFGLAAFFNHLKGTMPKPSVENQAPKQLDIDKLIDNF